MATPFDNTVPSSSEAFNLGAQRIRDLKTWLNNMIGQIFSDTNGTWIPGSVPLSAVGGFHPSLIQMQYAQANSAGTFTNVQTGGTNTPLQANMAIQNNISVTITPKSASSTLKITGLVHVGVDPSVNQGVIGAIFRDSTAAAISAQYLQFPSSASPSDRRLLQVVAFASAASVAATTFKLGVALTAAGNLFVNNSVSGLLGGTAFSSLTVEEFLAQ